MTRPHNCRHCASMCCGDANWCDERDEVMTDRQISVARNCPHWQWCEIDALTLQEWHECVPKKRSVALEGQMELVVKDD